MKYTKCSTNYRYIWYLIVWKLWNYEFIGKFDFFIDWKLLRFIITLFFLVGLDRMRCQDFHIQCSLKKLGRNWADCTIFKYSFFMVRLIRSKLHLLDSDRSPFFYYEYAFPHHHHGEPIKWWICPLFEDDRSEKPSAHGAYSLFSPSKKNPYKHEKLVR